MIASECEGMLMGEWEGDRTSEGGLRGDYSRWTKEWTMNNME